MNEFEIPIRERDGADRFEMRPTPDGLSIRLLSIDYPAGRIGAVSCSDREALGVTEADTVLHGDRDARITLRREGDRVIVRFSGHDESGQEGGFSVDAALYFDLVRRAIAARS